MLFEPLVAPFLYLEFGWAMREVFQSEVGWHFTGQWWIWVVLIAIVVFLLTYRDIRLSTTAGVILGAFEIVIFAALSVWMLISNAGDIDLQPFNPNHAVGGMERRVQGDGVRDPGVHRVRGRGATGRGGRHPRRTIPRAVVGSRS